MRVQTERLRPTSDGLQQNAVASNLRSDGLQPKSDGLQPSLKFSSGSLRVQPERLEFILDLSQPGQTVILPSRCIGSVGHRLARGQGHYAKTLKRTLKLLVTSSKNAPSSTARSP